MDAEELEELKRRHNEPANRNVRLDRTRQLFRTAENMAHRKEWARTGIIMLNDAASNMEQWEREMILESFDADVATLEEKGWDYHFPEPDIQKVIMQ